MGQFLGTFDSVKQGQVVAGGGLTVTFTCPYNQNWIVTQIALEMLTAPATGTCSIRKFNTLVAPVFSPRKAGIAGDPPIPVRTGESINIVWAGCTVGDIGKVYMIYDVTTI